MLYFEDLPVGNKQRFGRYEVTREEILAFAERYDPQPFHLSDEAAAKTHFGRLAASGWHTCSMAMSMLVKSSAERKQAGLGSPGVDELRWLKPVHPGDILSVQVEVVEKTPSHSRPEMGSYRSRVTVFNQDDIPVMSMITIVLIARRPSGQSAA